MSLLDNAAEGRNRTRIVDVLMVERVKHSGIEDPKSGVEAEAGRPLGSRLGSTELRCDVIRRLAC